jgi:hypothetical protein
MNAPEKVDLAAEAKIEPVRGNSCTEYRITGRLDAVFAAIESLFTNYHPHGYGTRVHAIDMGYGGKDDGLYIARVSRMNSCD